MNHFKDKKICKECKYYEVDLITLKVLSDISYKKCTYVPPEIESINYVDREVYYENDCYVLNKNGDCNNYLPMDFKDRLDYIFDKRFKDLELTTRAIVYGAKLEFLDICYPHYFCEERYELMKKLDFKVGEFFNIYNKYRHYSSIRAMRLGDS